MAKLLNLGCGSRFCKDSSWTNIDFSSSSNKVISHNLLQGLPFPDGMFDAVYHSHLLEHFTKEDGGQFIKECFRVLKAEGVLRIAVPDLQEICRLYLDALEKIESGDFALSSKYEWIKLEMYDQSVRTVSGGKMVEYLCQTSLPDKEFIISRIGSVGRDIIESVNTSKFENKAIGYAPTWKQWVGKIKRLPKKIRDMLILMVLNENQRKALRIGLFRLSGELHQWMYDSYSLRVLLNNAGFRNILRCSATESSILHWSTYSLDTDPDGFEHAPSSLYMEGVKPK